VTRPAEDPVLAFLTAVDLAVAEGRLGRLVLGKPTGEVQKWTVRPVTLKGGLRYQLVETRPGADRTTNLLTGELRGRIESALGTQFRSGHLSTEHGSLQLEWRKETPVLSKGKEAAAAKPAAHDRERHRGLQLSPAWTTALGLTEADGRPCRGEEAKLRQVHRFVEVLSHAIPAPVAPEGRPYRLVDVGCGRGALTFAAWQYLRATLPEGTPLEVVGVELRPALAEKTERISRATGCEGLLFRAGTIDTLPDLPFDVVVALHACDTATDDALALAHERGAQHVFVAPCCHKELRPQLSAPAALAPVLRHGILKTREADLATDALRAAVLEALGWDARVFEFVSTDHTDKNLMIAAVRRPEPRPEALGEARDLAAFFGVREQALARRVGMPLSG
jgi:SAM-dependent methyltransferase